MSERRTIDPGALRSPQERIRAVVARIPPGRVLTYGQVARLAGLPRRARMVGRVLRDTPSGRNLPWHRVVNAAGRSSFPADSARHALQLALLARDGAPLMGGRVLLSRCRWEPTLDELLWGPDGPEDRQRV